ncbi:hypothetical protein BGZ72_008212 [Mortierella alpina]|nr:hypothetical protein BGZ72_008212 [Mortierella alpina]
MSSGNLRQRLQYGSKTSSVQVHPGTPETQGEPYVLLSDIRECFPGAVSFVCGGQRVSFMCDSSDKRLLPERFAHHPGEVVDITIAAVPTCSPRTSHESNLISPIQIASQDVVPQSASVSPLVKDIPSQLPAFCVTTPEDDQQEQADCIRDDSEQSASGLKTPMAENHNLQEQMCETQQPMLHRQQQVLDQPAVKIGEADSLAGLDAFEGADLDHLNEFVKDRDQYCVPGNPYQIVTQEGHVTWVGADPCGLAHKETEEQVLAKVVEVNGGIYQPQRGRVSIALGSNVIATGFLDALVKAKHINELDISFDWDCSKIDLIAFENVIKNLRVSTLRLKFLHFQTSLASKLFLPSSRHDVLFRIINHSGMKAVHIVIPKDTAKPSAHPPTTSWYFSQLSFEKISRSIGGSGAMELYNSLKTNSTLTDLHLVGNSIGDSGAQALAAALKTNTTLTILNLVGNSIMDDGARALSKALKINSTLTTLDLRDNLIGYDGLLALSEIVRTNSTITTVNVRGNLIGIDSTLTFYDALKSKSIVLDLYHSSIGNEGVWALAEAARSNSTLMTLDLGSNSIGDIGALALCLILRSNTTLTTLGLRVNSIGNSGALALSQALKTNSTLKALNLGWNSITGIGALALSNALQTNSTLTTLFLGSNSIGDNGAQAMANALNVNSSLTTLYLASNAIGDDGAQALSKALKTNSTLTTLDLYDNLLGNKAARALSEGLKVNSALTTLYLGSNLIGDSGIIALAEGLETNTTLTILYVVGNPFEDNGVRALYELSKISICAITHGIEFSFED